MRGVPQGMAGMSWADGGFTLPSLQDGQNTMVIRTICDIMTSKDPQMQLMTKIFEEEQANKYGMDIAERLNPEDNKGFLRWTGQNPDWRQIPVAKMQSIFPRAFKAVQESDISVYVMDGKAHLHHDTAESFTVSKFSRPAMWMTQSVRIPIHADIFREEVMASKGWWDLTDNPVSNHFLNWAISNYDAPVLKFAVGIRLNTLKTPRTVHRDGDRDIQCCWCREINPDMAHIMCNCKQGRGWHYMNKRHRAIVDAVAAASRKGIKSVHIRDDVTISSICAAIDKEHSGLKRPDLMYESFITKNGKTKKIFNMTEITSPWAWEGPLKRAYEFKRQKYATVQVQFQQANPEYSEVRLNVIVVSPSGVFPMESQKDFAIATGLTRSELAAHSRFVVDAAIGNAFEHYGTYCKAMGYAENVSGARSTYTRIEQEFQEEAPGMEVVDSI
jgi:hypothetical protein